MKVHSFYLGCLAHASYLITDDRSKTAVVIDPQRDTDIYFDKAKELGVVIKHVLLTHFHADFVSGHLEIQQRSGATIHLGTAAGQPDYEHSGLSDGSVIEFGDTRIEALETPGHTPEGISYVLFHLTAEGDAPHAVFTGDTLFVGDVGRPDLLASVGVTAEELATQLYCSLHQKLMTLPDDTIVYPAHGAGSLCGKNLGAERSTTIGKQRESNCSVKPMSVEDFIARVTADQPRAPDYFGYDAKLNRQAHSLLDVAIVNGTRPLTAAEMLQFRMDGVQILDTRECEDFAAGSVTGALHVPLSGSFATWSGATLELGKPVIAIVAPSTEKEVAVRLGRIGIDTLIGFLQADLKELPDHPDVRQSHGTIPVEDLRRRLGDGEDLHILDVRTPTEFAGGSIATAQHIPLIDLRDRIAEIPRDRTVYVVCRSGARSSTAISLLMRADHDNLVNVLGGMNGWKDCEPRTGS